MTKHEELIEKVAEFLKDRDEALGCTDEHTDIERADSAKHLAALFFTALQVSTETMCNAAIDVDSFKLGDIAPLGFRRSPQWLFGECWQAMLNASPLAGEKRGSE